MNTKGFSIDREHIWHPYASMHNPPPVCDVHHTDGTHIVLQNGQRLIDGISSWWCASFGYQRQEIVEAIREQAAEMAHVMFGGLTHEPAQQCAEALLALLPDSLRHIFYADSGSIAVECAMKMALQYQISQGKTTRTRIVALRGGYHGDTIGAMSVSDPCGMHQIFSGVLPRQFFVEQPSCRFDAPWDEKSFAPMAEMLHSHSQEIAAVILEPIFQGANGMWFYHPQYLRNLRKTCNDLGIVLIFDEIATGFWRTGRLFAMEYANVVPDILCLGKTLTGGNITFACAIASTQIAEPIPTLLHGPTYMANPLACAAACASLKILQSADWGKEVARIEAKLRQTLAPCRQCPNVADVRILGAVGVLDVRHLPTAETLQKIVLKTGVWLRPEEHFIYTMPPFITRDDELERIARAMEMLAYA
ncbi:MAG: adenosylmethionine--8-amino-7-oxononanoate transaminase [Lentisphaeria bacterium]|nr:adenosylmethionine--8-amino-7-oxononanoate transaminase [Lentisphaeria bacterium]